MPLTIDRIVLPHPRAPEIHWTAPVPEKFPASTWLHKSIMAAAVALPFVGTCIAAAVMWQYGWMGWFYLGMLLGGWFFTGLGITIGFHRLLTHRSFETYPLVRMTLMALGALSVEG